MAESQEIWEVIKEPDYEPEFPVFEGDLSAAIGYVKKIPKRKRIYYSVALVRDRYRVDDFLGKYDG